jgi:CheY-like chemotaxis protein
MKKTILLADDDPEMREEICDILKDEGYTVLTAANGKEAIDALKKHNVNLLLLDLKMPVMNGYEVLRALEKEHIRVKTIVLTASIIVPSMPDEITISYEEKKKVLKLADAVLNKPVDLAMMVEKIKGMV